MMKKINRRHFVKCSVTGTAGMMYLPFMTKGRDTKQIERKLIYRTLGKTGIKIPVIGMGILSSGSAGLMRAALNAGITHFDSTAGLPQQIHNEEMIGEVLSGTPRDSVIFGTKIHLIQDYNTGLYTEAATEEEFLTRLDAALVRLKMDYVDIVYHHGVSRRESVFYEPIMNAMEKAKRAGKARFLGITTHGNVPEVVNAAAESGFYEVVMAAYNYRQNDYLQVREAIEKAARNGLGVVAIKIIRGGLAADEAPENPSASLKWVLQDTNVHATVPAFSNFEELAVDLSVMEDMELTATEKSYLRNNAAASGLFCQSCGQCLHQCKNQLPIPDLMRAYMYAYGYRQPKLARDLISSLNLPAKNCNECSTCSVACQNKWDIHGKIRDVVRLKAFS